MASNGEARKDQTDMMAGRRPWTRVDRCRMTAPEGDAPLRVTIEGHNLKQAIAPPRITVGGVPLAEVEFDPGGKVVRGVLREKPADRRVIVDYGFARSEAEAEWE